MLRRKRVILTGSMLLVFMTIVDFQDEHSRRYNHMLHILKEEKNNQDMNTSSFEEWKTEILLPSIKDNARNTLRAEFINRHKLLKEGCKTLQAKKESLGHQWSWSAVPFTVRDKKTKLVLTSIQHQGRYGICVIPKVGTTTWKTYAPKLLPGPEVRGNQTVNLIQVRHPLERLRSVYTDKYLGGMPLFAYDEDYRKAVDARESWNRRWLYYWMPALISSGQLIKTNFVKVIEELKNEKSFYKELSTKRNKILPLSVRNPGNQFNDINFTFEQFLRHVLWTKDLGLGDHHWVPQSEQCNVCAGDFEYILKLENIGEELHHALKALNYKNIPFYQQTHKSKNISSHMEFYKDIPADVMRKIVELYKYDFILFGYPLPVIGKLGVVEG